MNRAKEKKGNLSYFLCAWVSDTQVPLVLPWGEWGLYFARVTAGRCEEMQPEAAGGKLLVSREYVPAGQPQCLLWLLWLFSVEGMNEEPNWGTQDKSWGEGGGVSRNCSNREGALWFAPVPVPGAIATQSGAAAAWGSLGAALLRGTLHNALIEFSHFKEAPEVLEERAGGRGELFPCAQMWCTPKFQTRHWSRDSKEQGQGHGQHLLARPWCPAGPEAGRTTNICKHSAENIPLLQCSKSRKWTSREDFPWLSVFPAMFKKCWGWLWRLWSDSFESTTGLFIMILFLMSA